ncbi:MAG: glycosyltransferase family 4 protein [Planctomycetota bacterium]
MRIACLNQDRGISPARKKGAAVHLAAMRAAFRDLGAEVLEIDDSDAARTSERLEELHRGQALDLVYERYALGCAAGATFSRRHGVPLVLEVNAPLAEEDRRYRDGTAAPDLAAAEALVLGSAARIIAVSSLVAEYAIERGAPPGVVQVHPNGVDVTRFRPRRAGDPLRERLVPPGRFAVGFHGRLRPWHGIELLAGALALLLAREVPVHVVFVGEGGIRAALGEKVPADRLTAVDWVPHEDVGQYVAAFDALPLTYSRGAPCYFSPLKLAESMACGVVPVFPPLGDLPRLLRDGVNAVAYPPDDAPALAAALQGLVADPARRAGLAVEAVRTAHALGWDRIAAAVLECAGRRRGSER